ncbi:GNAT family N-acetyltransferase, partial [Lactobacillus sp. XV13L]|nr:GNAT family N-acetyltransferase [Lactobacillus sp. XV13L]
LNIREKVFVAEQKVPQELEVDQYENKCTYYVLYRERKPVATTRFYTTEDNGWHIQRVAVLKPYRRQGYAKQLLLYIEDQAQKAHIDYLTLGAQDQAQGFYSKLGFVVQGPQFLDAGIKHHKMVKYLHNKGENHEA